MGNATPVYETDSYKAVRGGEQYHIEEARKSGNAVDQINGISPRKANKNVYEAAFANPENNKTGILDDNLSKKITLKTIDMSKGVKKIWQNL